MVIEESAVEIAGAAVRYLRAGSGSQTLLLVHGGIPGVTPYTLTADMWRPAIDRLKGDFQVVALDLPGAGGSAVGSDGRTSYRGAARLVRSLLAHLGVKQFHLVAHGESSLVASEYLALEASDVLLRTITLVSPSGMAPLGDSETNLTVATPLRPLWSKASQQWAMETIAELPEVMDRATLAIMEAAVVGDKMRTSLRELAPLGDRAADLLDARGRFFAYYRDVKRAVPTTVLWGFNDPFVPFAVGTVLVEVLCRGDAQVDAHVKNCCGHLAPLEAPDWLANRIARHVERFGSAADQFPSGKAATGI